MQLPTLGSWASAGAHRLVIYDSEDRLPLVLGWVGVERGHWGMLGGAVGPVSTAHRNASCSGSEP
jgi:hypothetical protein